MPEIAEVARAVHHLRHHLRNRTIASVNALDDNKLFLTAKTGLTGPNFAAELKGKKVLDARQQGKYFWLVMDSPPHPLMHFGMTGWIKFKGDGGSGEYRRMKEKKEREKAAQKAAQKEEIADESSEKEEEDWPPRFWKFVMQMEGEDGLEAAFVDSRRFGAVRLLDVPAEKLRNTSPLKENGPDPVVDKGVVTQEWLSEKLQKKRVPIKALLLDQAVISGIGNWVADEVLYQARIHPEQYCNTLDDAQTERLHDKLIGVCTTACDLLADSSKFPDTWLMRHRWDKGKKGGSQLPSGEKIMHVTVGGRTSAVVPSVQKKTGPVAGDVSGDEEDESEVPPREVNGKQKKGKGADADVTEANPARNSKESQPKADGKVNGANRRSKKPKTASPLTGKKRKSEQAIDDTKTAAKKTKTTEKKSTGAASGRRKSARLSKT